MKRILGFLLCAVILMIAGCAAAEVHITALPKDKIGVITPDGLAFTKTEADGELTIAIDTDGSDWAKAIAHTGTGAGDAEMIWQIKAPDGVGMGSYVIMAYAEDDQEAAVLLEEKERKSEYNEIGRLDGSVAAMPNGMPITERGVSIATSVAELGYLVPAEYEQNIYVRWYDSAKTPVTDAQKLAVRFTHTRTEPFQTKISYPAVDSGRIQANTNGVSGVEALEEGNGLISYYIPQSDTPVRTAVTAPTGASRYALQGNLKSGGSGAPLPLENGCAVIDTVRPDGLDACGGATTVFFYDGAGNVKEIVSLTISCQSFKELLPWPAYDDSFYPIYEDLLTITNGAEGAGFAVSYDESTGRLSTRYDGNITPGAPMGKLTLTVKTPPWGPYAYRLYEVGGNSLLGPSGGSLEGLQVLLDQRYDSPEEIASGTDAVYSEESAPYKVIVPRDDAIKIYVPESNAQYMTHLYVIEWYNDPDNADDVDRMYFWKTTEPFTIVERTIPVTSMDKLPRPVEKPQVVCKTGGVLLITSYFTEGENVWHYDLKLLDDSGRPQTLQAPVRVLLPYPKNHAEGKVYTLNHYTDDLYRGRALGKNESIRVTATEYGLMFETKSFSPFILSTAKAAPAAPATAPVGKLPKTGDTTPLALLAFGLLCSGAALLALRRRRRA
ncbi:MAG: LPXTG cell wall anchor domain-containing protein [Clostridiales bacterium]|nr:LPXTG cell wall anchor domain-containing protein [Clostridiales bacterium]